MLGQFIPRWPAFARYDYWLALLSGALLPLAFAPFHLFPMAFISPAILFALLQGPGLSNDPRRSLKVGFVFGLGLFGVGVSWVFIAIYDFGQSGLLVAFILTLLFVSLLSSIPASLGYCTAKLIQRVQPRTEFLLLILLPCLWVLFEWLRGWLFTGFPWLSLGYSQIDTPLSGLAPVLGVYGISLVCVMMAGALVYLFQTNKQTRNRALAIVLPLVFIVWLGSWILGQMQWTQASGVPLKVSLVQGNQPQLRKWDTEKIQQRLDVYAGASMSRMEQSDLIVWPENAVTVFYHELEDNYFAQLEEEAVKSNTEIVLGLPVLHDDEQHYFTSMMSLTSRQFYHKHHLVPFGEFIPLEGLFRGMIAFFDLPMSAFSSGPKVQLPLSVAGQKAAATVCYEDAFGNEVIRALPEATLLINGSNNAWYGDSLAPHQHLQISRMRTIETGRPLLRATTNGISAIVDHKGQLLATSPQFETYVLDGEIQPMADSTPFIRWGNYPVLFIVLFGLAVVVFVSWRDPRKPRF